jgi:hypothetical protein
MNTRSRLSKSVGILILTLVATVCAASLISVRGESKKTLTGNSPAFGVAPGQFARLSASNVFGDATMHVDFAVIDAVAGTINTIVPRDVPPGGTTFFDFGLPVGQAARQEFRTTFTYSPTVQGNSVQSIQVIDTDSQNTGVFISGNDFTTVANPQ